MAGATPIGELSALSLASRLCTGWVVPGRGDVVLPLSVTNTCRVRSSSRACMSDPAVRWFGVLVAALAAILLLISGFAPWWGFGQSTITGWGAVGGTGKLVIVSVVVAGFLSDRRAALPTGPRGDRGAVRAGARRGPADRCALGGSERRGSQPGGVTTGAPLAFGS